MQANIQSSCSTTYIVNLILFASRFRNLRRLYADVAHVVMTSQVNVMQSSNMEGGQTRLKVVCPYFHEPGSLVVCRIILNASITNKIIYHVKSAVVSCPI